MSDKNFKTIRKQLHNVLQGLLPQVLATELVDGIYKKLQKQVADGLKALNDNVSARLDALDERQKTINDSVVRNVIAPSQIVPPNLDTKPVEVDTTVKY